MNKSESSGHYFGALRNHASAAVENQADAGRHILIGKERDALKLAVFKNTEMVLGEPGHVSSTIVFDSYIQKDQLGLGRKPVIAARRLGQCRREQGDGERSAHAG